MVLLAKRTKRLEDGAWKEGLPNVGVGGMTVL